MLKEGEASDNDYPLVKFQIFFRDSRKDHGETKYTIQM